LEANLPVLHLGHRTKLHTRRGVAHVRTETRAPGAPARPRRRGEARGGRPGAGEGARAWARERCG